MSKDRTIPVFTMRMATFLISEGWILDHLDKDNRDPMRLVFYFRNAPGIYDDMNRFRQEGGEDNAER